MNPTTLEIGLRTAGLVLSGLIVANFFAASRWRYAENLAGADNMVRQIFHVHCAYLISIMAGLALLCLGWPELLMEGKMSRALCGFFGLFWGSRVVVQLTYYDKKVRSNDRGWDVFFFCVFAFLATIFTLTAIHA